MAFWGKLGSNTRVLMNHGLPLLAGVERMENGF
jgi:hypothetical protein